MVKPYLLSAYKDKDSLITGWRDIHHILANKSSNPDTIAELLGYAIYYYAVYRAFQQEQDALRAKELLEHSLRLVSQQVPSVWTTTRLDEVIALAWVHTELVQMGVISPDQAPVLTELDDCLLTEASLILARKEAGSRARFLRIVRYFSLRLPEQVLPTYWAPVLALVNQALAEKAPGFWFDFTRPEGAEATKEKVSELGLADGLAGELLLLMGLAQAGAQQLVGIQEQIQQGLVYILAAKREVDFSEKRYAIFPDQITNDQDEATFSNELSWRHGDLGQALLLYKGYHLLQDEELLRLAELTGLNTLLRVDVRSTAVTNSQFSSGAAGVAQLYRLLYQLSSHEAYRKGYAFWLTQTRSWLTHELGTDFYHRREGDLLNGLVGVGLVLLSAISEPDLRWEQLLML